MADLMEREEEAAPVPSTTAARKEQTVTGGDLTHWPRWLRSKTGPGDLASYHDHVANLWGSTAGARIARGLDGLTGGASLAVLDILLGLLGLLKLGPVRQPAAPEKEATPDVHRP